MITVKYLSYGTKREKIYNNFSDLKNKVIQILDSCGWDNKKQVDLRSIKSCAEYVHENVTECKVKY